LAYNLALCGSQSNTPEPTLVERLDFLLSLGAHVHISDERMTFLKHHAHPSLFDKIQASFGAIDFRNQLHRETATPRLLSVPKAPHGFDPRLILL